MPSATLAEPQLVEPAFRACPPYVGTLGDEVADLSELAGMTPDPEQKLGLDMLFGLDEHGRSAAFEFAVICCRQNLKTGLFKQAALGWLFLTDQRLVVWSAHEFSTAQEAHRDIAELIDGCHYLSRRVKAVYDSAAYRAVELMPPPGSSEGPRLVFKARTNKGGKGLTGDKVVLDEAFALRPSHMGALLPTLSARPDPQVVYGSSAGYAESSVLRAIRDRGRSIDAGRLAYLEWCARFLRCEQEKCGHALGTPGCSFDRFENVQQANPLLGRRRANGTGLTWEYVQAERAAMPADEYARERLGRWDEPGAAEIFGPGRWDDCAAAKPDDLDLAAFGIAVAVDQSSAAIVAAASTGPRLVVKPLRHGPGTGWVLDAAAELWQRYRVPVVVDEGGPAADLIPFLEDDGIRLIKVSTKQYLDACAGFYRAVRDLRLSHADYPELTRSVNGATTRKVGDRWAWGRRSSSSDITPLEAATLAGWWVDRPAYVPPPPPKPRVAAVGEPVRERVASIARAGF